MVFCLNNCIRLNPGEYINVFDGVPYPVFKYAGQISKNEVKAQKNCLALVLNVESGFSGLVIKFIDCSQIEIDLVRDQVFEIAREIIDFHFMFHPHQIFQVIHDEVCEYCH